MTALEWITAIATAGGALIAALALLAAVRSLSMSQEAQRDLLRPIMRVAEEHAQLQMNADNSVNLETASQRAMLIDAGSGLAAHVQGVMFGPKEDEPFTSDRRLSFRLHKVLAAGEGYEAAFSQGGTVVHGSTKVEERRGLLWWRRKYTLWVPQELSASDLLAVKSARVIARLTVTYHDVYGRKHASIYDFTELHGWEPVAFLKDIRYDLDELNRRDSEVRRPAVIGAVTSRRKRATR